MPQLAQNQSGKNWAASQARDPFVVEARKRGYVCRSAFKLTAIDDKYKLFLPGQTKAVVDLGASPGGWCQVIRERCGQECEIVGVDLLKVIAPLPGATFLQADVSKVETLQMLDDALLSKGVAKGMLDVVTSDMCPNRSGGRDDYHRSAQLNEVALLFALERVKIGGHFVCKVLGTSEAGFADLLRVAQLQFTQAKIVKPAACRSVSDESFLVCLGKLEKPRSRADVSPFQKTKRGPQEFRVAKYGLDDWPGMLRNRQR